MHKLTKNTLSAINGIENYPKYRKRLGVFLNRAIEADRTQDGPDLPAHEPILHVGTSLAKGPNLGKM